jgi:hypothetical protein
MKAQRDDDRIRRERNEARALRKADLEKQTQVTSIIAAVAKHFLPDNILQPDRTNLRQWERTIRLHAAE